MKKKYHLRRDPLDYLLTDTTPVEISELFTYTYFYAYLHQNRKKLDNILKIVDQKEKNTFDKTLVPFDKGWITTPLTYGVVKNDGSSIRKMSIPQPVSVLNMYLFINLYQKDILNYLDHPRYSVRYQKRNVDLFYRPRNKGTLIDYQYRRDRRSKKAVEQTGRYFDIKPFERILDLERSDRWIQANLNYKLFCKLDYKRCFDSIYTHSYKWIVTRDVIDSKSFKNSSTFAVIDRVLQNINGSSSNGVLVGPEFSRMIVEILLQAVDNGVYHELSTHGLRHGIDYEIMRFVDDMFVFSKNEDTQELILSIIDKQAAPYLLEINKLKTERQPTPYYRAAWINDVEAYKDKLISIFRTNKDIEQSGDTFQISCRPETIQKLKVGFENLIAKYKNDRISITNYVMSVLFNSMSSKNRDYTFFKTKTHRSIVTVLDYAYYIFCHAVSFQNNQKLISILYYIHNEIDLSKSNSFQGVIDKYEPRVTGSNYSDYMNQLVAFGELNTHFGSVTEDALFDAALKADDPIALATIVSYAKYDDLLLQKYSGNLNKLLEKKINTIQEPKDTLKYREFWYVLIFNKCPYISPVLQSKFNGIIKKLLTKSPDTSAKMAVNIFAEFLLDPDETYSFIAWNTKGARMLEEITYRTSNKTVFRRGLPTIGSSF